MPASLCPACAWVRVTHGKRGQSYYLCRNEAVPVKYPPQPVLRCPGYAPAGAAGADGAGGAGAAAEGAGA